MRAVGITSRIVRTALVLVAAGLVLAPVLATGFYGDDASDANLNGALALRHMSLLQAMLATATVWIEANGRLFPLYVAEKYTVFHVFGDVGAYKTFLYALTLVTLLAFLAFVRSLAGFRFAAVATLFVALSLQMRGYHDALYAYNGMIQIMLLVLLGSLWCWRAFLNGGSPLWGIAALVLYAANGLTYEFSYLFFPLYAVVSPKMSLRALATAVAPPAVVALVLGIVAAVLRSHAAIAPGSAYAIGASPVAYVTTLARQIAAALPLSYYAWNPSRIFPVPAQLLDRSGGYAFSGWAALFFAFVTLVLIEGLRREVGAGRPWPVQRVVWFGAGLWLLPALLVALSGKYQRELTWGIGYLPVLIEVFGVGLLLAAAAAALFAILPLGLGRAAVLAIALLGGLSGAVTLADNRRLALELTPWRVSRAVVANALGAGVAAGVPDGSTLRVAGDLPWLCFAELGCPDDLDAAAFVYAAGGKRVRLRPASAGDGAYLLRYGHSGLVAWVAVGPVAGGDRTLYLEALPACKAAAPFGPGAGQSLGAGDRWKLVRLDSVPAQFQTACGPVDLGSWPG